MKLFSVNNLKLKVTSTYFFQDQMNLMSETKKTFDSLSSAHPSFQRESNPAESVPQVQTQINVLNLTV